jgi:hypothetical protein
VLLILSTLGNLTQVPTWIAFTIYVWKTPLRLLKMLALMFSAMNLAWWLAVLILYKKAKYDDWNLKSQQFIWSAGALIGIFVLLF